MSKLTHKERAILALEGRQPDFVPTFELAFQLTEEVFGSSFNQSVDYNNLSEPDRRELCRLNAELYLAIAERYEHSIIMVAIAPSTVFPQRAQELVWTMKSIRDIARRRGEDYLLVTHGDTTLELPEGKWLERMIELLADNPAQLHVEAENRMFRSALPLYLGQCGFDGFALCADYAFNANPFFAPEQFAEFVTPYLKRLIAAYRGMEKYVIKHSDGNLMPILEQIVQCEPHAIHSLDPQGGMDIAAVKSRYGEKVALCGNVNCGLMQTGTDDEVLASCEYAMRHGKPGGGFIFCTSNCVFKGMPPERYELMIDYWRRHRYY